jgi:hypothetical protein
LRAVAEADPLDEIAARATELARDAIYVGVGFGVLTLQRLMVAGRELQSAIDSYFNQRK